jgi:hypothetical protein
MRESLVELWKEQEVVQPKDVAEKMSQKLNRPIHYSYASWLLRTFGFVTSRNGLNQNVIIKDDEIMERLQGVKYGSTKVL